MELTLEQLKALLSKSYWKNDNHILRFSSPNLTFDKAISKYDIIEESAKFYILLLELNNYKIEIIDANEFVLKITVHNEEQDLLRIKITSHR